MKVTIVIPAYNEQNRIGTTLQAYCAYFNERKMSEPAFDYQLLVALNGCTDNTAHVVQEIAQQEPAVHMIMCPRAGKGEALIYGFGDALRRTADLIGFVDADMATAPQYFDELIKHAQQADGVIASRYMPGATVIPTRPFFKRWGSKLVYESLVTVLFGMRYYDYQCGAKLFNRAVIERIIDQLTVKQWALDVELLFLCKKYGYTIKEIPTYWCDRKDSKLSVIKGGARMIGGLFKVRLQHSTLARLLRSRG